jgi:hypothetical protein
MDDHRIPEENLTEEIYGRTKRGRTRKRWIKKVEETLRKINIRDWRVRTQYQQDWRRTGGRPRSRLDCSPD